MDRPLTSLKALQGYLLGYSWGKLLRKRNHILRLQGGPAGRDSVETLVKPQRTVCKSSWLSGPEGAKVLSG
jgi:hypothetical protein